MHIQRFFLFFLLVSSQILFSPPLSRTVFAEEKEVLSSEKNAAEEQARISAEIEKIRSYAEMSLKTGAESVQELQNRLSDIEKLGKEIETEISLYEIQLSGHSNLLLLPEARIEDLIKAQSQHHAALKNVLEYIADIQSKVSLITRQQQQTADQYSLNVSQLANLKNEMPRTPVTEKLAEDLNSLIDLIETRQEVLGKIRNIYEKTAETLVKTRSRLTDLSEKFERIIAEKKRQAIFMREKSTIVSLRFSEIREEMLRVPARSVSLLGADYQRIAEMGPVPPTAFVLIFCLVLIFVFRFRSWCSFLDAQGHLAENYPSRHFVLSFFSQSLPLTGLLLYIAVFGHIRNLTASLSFYRPLVYILYVWLWSRWGIDFMALWNARQKKQIPESLRKKLRNLLLIIRVFTISMLTAAWLIGPESRTVLLLRISFYMAMLAWCLFFWRKYRETIHRPEERPVSPRLHHTAMVGISFLIPFGAIFLELIGFGNMADFWFASWSFSFIGLLWAWLLFRLLREWGEKFRDSSLITSSEKKNRRPIQWLLIQFCWLLWGSNVLLAAVFAWHPDKSAVISGYFEILTHSLPVPNMQISILSLFYTVAVLLVTHAGTRVWRMLLSEKLLAHSGFDPGLKNSITVVSSYLLWFFGILIALSIIGVEGQSLAVAFGGLGIGLGFGLQAIFNNFISGIIMLFERPIQVGDVVEVGGIWGEVKKINVRSTEVKTYDYATLIIPNSKMISDQLTNWSFNDKRVRRSVYV
ncbi:MAG: mechanosensitive ion channel, partial [Desulfobacterales bacterium]